MKHFIKSETNENYCASVVTLKEVRPHTNPKINRVQLATIFGNTVIVPLHYKNGDKGIYFPPETKISTKFLSFINGFRNKELNVDTSKTGYFEDNGRVEAVTFHGERSFGFFVDISTFNKFSNLPEPAEGIDFDYIKTELFCEKYEIPGTTSQQHKKTKVRAVKNKPKYSLVPYQFKLHRDTPHFGKSIVNVNPDTLISITEKLHGQNAVFSKVLVRKTQSFWQKIFGLKNNPEYRMVYSSRRIIRILSDKPILKPTHLDVWAKQLNLMIPDGFSFYGEIVGFHDGKPLQKQYDYGCDTDESRFLCFRVTYTDKNGRVMELSVLDSSKLCTLIGISFVPIHFTGKAKELVPDWNDAMTLSHFHKKLFDTIEHSYVNGNCIFCKNIVPKEGVVITIENNEYPDRPASKFKNSDFILRETKKISEGEIEEQ